MLQAIVRATNIQDRDGGTMLLGTLFGMFRFLLKLYADGGYWGLEFQSAPHILSKAEVQIVNDPTRRRASSCRPGDWSAIARLTSGM
jgi:hypothetical protein